jgi:hypothetical protein
MTKSKMKDLARLAADERTPDGERRNAAMALAKMFNGGPVAEQDAVFEALTKQHAKLQVDFDIVSIELDLLKKRKVETDAKIFNLKNELQTMTLRATKAEALVPHTTSAHEERTEAASVVHATGSTLRLPDINVEKFPNGAELELKLVRIPGGFQVISMSVNLDQYVGSARRDEWISPRIRGVY